VAAIKEGAVDFLLKPVRARELFHALQKAYERYKEILAVQAQRREWALALAELSEREREVLELVVQGLLNKQIAGRLGIALRTVKLHRANMLAKLKVGSVAELARKVERLGLPDYRK
jgi:FixJ family two-component response regulator